MGNWESATDFGAPPEGQGLPLGRSVRPRATPVQKVQLKRRILHSVAQVSTSLRISHVVLSSTWQMRSGLRSFTSKGVSLQRPCECSATTRLAFAIRRPGQERLEA